MATFSLAAVVPNLAGTKPVAQPQPIAAMRGDDLRVNVVLVDQAGAPFAIAGGSGGALKMTVVAVLGGPALFTKTATVDNDGGGLAHFTIDAADTAALAAGVNFYYDVVYYAPPGPPTGLRDHVVPASTFTLAANPL
jgi:hypothetical protein